MIAAVLSAIIALILGGKKRWAMEVTLPVLILVGIPVGGASLVFWIAPTLVQGRLGMRPQSLVAFRQDLLEFAWLTVPSGAVLGVVVGGMTGLVLLLAHRWPRFVRWFVIALLLTCAISFVHIKLFRYVTNLTVEYRLHGLKPGAYGWYSRYELTSAVGAIAGAVVGAIFSCTAVWLDRRRSSWQEEKLSKATRQRKGHIAREGP